MQTPPPPFWPLPSDACKVFLPGLASVPRSIFLTSGRDVQAI
ncbi:MAG TPA: hypothetical protein VH374_10715 [Polyangia bacterium]|jgi:hypothetical protein|nr:hypothetical protein [Polyangia bacterium]